MLAVTLTSDFGDQHYAIASIKGTLLRSFPGAQIIDIAHHITPYHTQQAAYIFKQAYDRFPAQTIHFIFNNMFQQNAKQLLYVYMREQHIFCADNGILTLLFDHEPVQLFRLNYTFKTENYTLKNILTQFINHAQALLEHDTELHFIPIDVNDIVVKHRSRASYNQNVLDAGIQYIDRYGNVVLNASKEDFDEVALNRPFEIRFVDGTVIKALSKGYIDSANGRAICFFNDAGFLEIAVRNGDASKLLGLREQGEESIFYHSIKIKFE
ncbi:MAG: SAM-dependent chlorinase/fluorinase [Chitinophagaceae bacterium]